MKITVLASRFIVSACAVIFFALSLTTIFKARHVLVWKLSILATEYGHWMAAATLAIIVIALLSRMTGLSGGVAGILLILSLLLFARPYAQAAMMAPRWATDLHSNLGVTVTGPLISFMKLWFGQKESLRAPEKIEVRSGEEGNLSMDFYRSDSQTPAPWVVVIHGGGWDSGDPSQFPEFNARLARQGYAVAAVSYRLAPTWKWPAQREDVQASIDFVKAHAKELNVDPNRWVIMGRSAGGQIAETIAYRGEDASLKGLIAFYSPADLEFAFEYAADKDIINSRSLLSNFLGGIPAQVEAVYKDASPIRFVTPNSPPTLLFHGEMDPLTWNVQSHRLLKRISEMGARGAFIEFPWATHAFDYNMNGPAGQVAMAAVEGFLSMTLKGDRNV